MGYYSCPHLRRLDAITIETAPIHFLGGDSSCSTASNQKKKKNVNQLGAKKPQDSLKVIKGMKFVVKE